MKTCDLVLVDMAGQPQRRSGGRPDADDLAPADPNVMPRRRWDQPRRLPRCCAFAGGSQRVDDNEDG